MARGDSTIKVSIIGDAKQLVSSLKQADAATGGLLKSTAVGIGGTLLALGAVREGFQFVGDSLDEADRLGDAIQNINIQLGALAQPLIDTAGNFAKLGQSKQDMIELENRFADIATAIGIADQKIADTADDAAATAAALALLGDKTPAEELDLIAKAAGGSAKAAKELGVTLIAGADGATQLDNILAQLKPKLDAATTGTGDLEQKQAELNARVETLQASLGEKLAPALADVLQFINDEIDAIPHAIQGFQSLGRAVESAGRTMLGPLGNVRDALEGILSLLGQAAAATSHGSFDETAITRANRNYAERNGLTGP